MNPRLPRHLANEPVPATALPSIGGIDVQAAADAAVALGADADRFAFYLAAGLAAGGAEAIDLIGLAAWRAGAIALRDDALARLERMVGTASQPAASAALGIATIDLGTFVSHQLKDRWWWSGRDEAQGYVAAVGGFAGLGGEWTEPPRCGVELPEDGAFAILAGEHWWRLDSDVWGSRLLPVEEPPDEWLDAVPALAPSALPAGGSGHGTIRVLARSGAGQAGNVELVVPEHTHLAWLRVVAS